jgi:zinc transport system substrate-binding protein
MLWEGYPLDESVKRLEHMGVGSIVFAPCMNTPEEGDFMSVMKQNVENLRAIYQ